MRMQACRHEEDDRSGEAGLLSRCTHGCSVSGTVQTSAHGPGASGLWLAGPADGKTAPVPRVARGQARLAREGLRVVRGPAVADDRGESVAVAPRDRA